LLAERERCIIARVLGSLEQFLSQWLGNASAVGASSWLQAFTWVATLVAALIGGVALRRNSLQGRATLLLNLHKIWEDLADKRQAFSEFFNVIRRETIRKCPNLQEKHQTEQMRKDFQVQLAALRDARDPKFSQFTSYLSFFEILGMYVKNGYVPLRDVMQVYKGPIFSIDIAWRDFISAWEKEAHVPSGLLEHAVLLMKMARARAERPVYYWMLYRFRRYL
jgi:hypothetical protein